MARKKKNTNETSGLITGVGTPWSFYNESWCGLPGNAGYDSEPIEATLDGQFVVDENSIVWFGPARWQGHRNNIIPAPNGYPMAIGLGKEGWWWIENPGALPSPSTSTYTPILSGITVYVGDDRIYSYDTGWRLTYITEESAKAGARASTETGWIKVGPLTSLYRDASGTHIWFSGIGYYVVETPVYPLPFEKVFNFQEIPWDYYPCAIYDNGFKSCNDPGRSFKIYNSGWQDVKNMEGGPSTTDKAHIYNNNNWQKILKG